MSVLSLSTEQKQHEKIEVDGEEYVLANLDDMSFANSSYMSWAGNKIDELLKSEEWGEGQGEKLQELLDNTCRLLLPDMPKDVYDKLNDNHKLEIFQAFNKAAGLEENPTESSSEEQ